MKRPRPSQLLAAGAAALMLATSSAAAGAAVESPLARGAPRDDGAPSHRHPRRAEDAAPAMTAAPPPPAADGTGPSIDHRPLHFAHPGAVPCPGYETSTGYASLAALRADLAAYYSGIHPADEAPTKAPTATPTEAPATDAPSGAPITAAPTTDAPATAAPVTTAPTPLPTAAPVAGAPTQDTAEEDDEEEEDPAGAVDPPPKPPSETHIPQNATNWALYGEASQSTTCFNAEASRAIDGRRSQFMGSKSVAHTCAQESPWWEVDLGEAKEVGHVVIQGRLDPCCWNRLNDAEVAVLKANRKPSAARGIVNGLNEVHVSFDPPVKGRYVRVQKNVFGDLALAEVMVYSEVFDIPNGAPNADAGDGGERRLMMGGGSKGGIDGRRSEGKRGQRYLRRLQPGTGVMANASDSAVIAEPNGMTDEVAVQGTVQGTATGTAASAAPDGANAEMDTVEDCSIYPRKSRCPPSCRWSRGECLAPLLPSSAATAGEEQNETAAGPDTAAEGPTETAEAVQHDLGGGGAGSPFTVSEAQAKEEIAEELAEEGTLEWGELIEVPTSSGGGPVAGGGAAVDGAGGAAAWQPGLLDASEVAITDAATASHSADAPPPVTFSLCPRTTFDFGDDFGPPAAVPPLTLRTPSLQRPVEIACLAVDDAEGEGGEGPADEGDGRSGRSCVFTGGDVHLLFEHRPAMGEGEGSGGRHLDERPTASEHPVSISGIAFRGAKQSSVLMRDPRGKVRFRNCAWEENGGTAAVRIDGRYDSSADTEAGEAEDETMEFGGWGAAVDGTTDAAGEGAETVASTSATSAATASTTTAGPLAEANAAAARADGTSTAATTSTMDHDLEKFDDGAGSGRKRQRGHGRVARRAAEGTGWPVADAPRAIVSIEECAFVGNTGDATILLLAHSREQTRAERDPGALTLDLGLLDGDAAPGEGRQLHKQRRLQSAAPAALAHTVHLSLRSTTFSNENVTAAVLDNDGGRVQCSRCVFANNTANSIIRSEAGTVALTATEFDSNSIRGDEGTVVLDAGSMLEANDGSCARMATVADDEGGKASPMAKSASLDKVDGGRRLDGTAEEGGASAAYCEGIQSGGVCTTFVPCPSLGARPSCYSDWETLAVAVRDRPQNQRDFTICPGAALVATEPVILDGDYLTVQCGTELSPSNDCSIAGGFSHFHVVGSAKGVQLARLSMSGATGASILALGTDEATLHLKECAWTQNAGAAAILIHRDIEDLSVVAADGNLEALDVPLLSRLAKQEGGKAMAVEVSHCTFRDNDLEYGAVANLGGTLSIDRTRFAANSGKGGDVVVTNQGSLALKESCFDASASVAPGVVFVEEGSAMTANADNFGAGNTAGGYAAGGTCAHVFLEAAGGDCLGAAARCDGRCRAFAAPTCRADGGGGEGAVLPGTPAAAPDGQIYVPSHTNGEGSGNDSSNVVPIVVASIVGVFIVLGFVGIVARRRKAAANSSESSGNAPSSGGGACGCFKGRARRRGSSAACHQRVDVDDGTDDDDEEVP